MRGVPLRLVDTAGIRGSHDELERAGIARTEQSLEAADLVLHIVDRSEPKPIGFMEPSVDASSILLLNKSDLPEHPDWSDSNALRLSCISENGLEGLEQAILDRLGETHIRAENSVAINMRHRDCLRRALEAADHAAETLARGYSAEYAVVDLRAALAAVTEVIGSAGDDAILDSLFAQFCIGK